MKTFDFLFCCRGVNKIMTDQIFASVFIYLSFGFRLRYYRSATIITLNVFQFFATFHLFHHVRPVWPTTWTTFKGLYFFRFFFTQRCPYNLLKKREKKNRIVWESLEMVFLFIHRAKIRLISNVFVKPSEAYIEWIRDLNDEFNLGKIVF